LRGNHYKRSNQSWVDKVAAVTLECRLVSMRTGQVPLSGAQP
jgi:hypothetical protein